MAQKFNPAEHLEAIRNPDCGWFYRASATDFRKIPGSPIAYWLSTSFLATFELMTMIGEVVELRAGISTGDNTIFQREWYEVA